MTYIFGLLPAMWSRLDRVPGSWFRTDPDLTVATIRGMKKQWKLLFLSPTLFVALFVCVSLSLANK